MSPSEGTLRLVGQTPTVTAGSVDTAALVDFDTPTNPPKAGVDQQRFRVLVRKTDADDPTVDISLYEGGVLVAALQTGVTVSSATGQIVEAYWDASALSDPTGAGVQCYVYGHTNGASKVEIGAVVWESRATAAIVVSPNAGILRLVGQTPSVTVSGAEEYRETPAGRRRRRRYAIEIDGRQFVTESLAEAEALLRQAQSLAPKAAERQAERIVKRAVRTGEARTVALPVPTISAPPELEDAARQAREQIAAAYRDAALVAEIQLLLQLQQELDDEEALLLLM